MKFEPALIVQLVGAALALVVAFGIPVSQEQRESILAFVAIVVAIMVGQGIVTRAFVVPTAQVEKIAAASARTGVAQV